MDQIYAGISPKMLQFLKTLELVKRISMKQLIVTAIGKKNNSTYKLYGKRNMYTYNYDLLLSDEHAINAH